MPPPVPCVIRVEDDALSIVSSVDNHRPTENGNGPEHVILNGRWKRVLPQSRYNKALASIIERDYFPSPLITPLADQSDQSKKSLSTATLTHFHLEAASDRQVDFQQSIDEYARDKRIHVENTKYPSSSKEQNAVFYPVIPRGQPQNRIEALPASITATNTPSSMEVIISNSNRTIIPEATRFPQPKPKVPQHWERDSTVDDVSSNGWSTDLDSTIVLSLRSEIRRGRLRKARKVRESSSSGKSVGSILSTQRRRPPPLDSDESIGYALRKAYKRPRQSSSTRSTASVHP